MNKKTLTNNISNRDRFNLDRFSFDMFKLISTKEPKAKLRLKNIADDLELFFISNIEGLCKTEQEMFLKHCAVLKQIAEECCLYKH